MKNNTRTSYSIRNSITSLISNIMAIIIGFIAQGLFVKILNVEYLGLNSLFTNILTMLSFFELGIGNAIVFYMYKPLAEKDENELKKLVNFYKTSYRVIAFIVFLVGVLIIPFLKFLINDITINVNIYIVYMLFLTSSIVSYLMVYKRNIIYADQKNYIINNIHCLYLIILNILQLLILFLTKNYYLFLIIKIFCQLIENYIITIYANKKYPYIKDNNSKLEKESAKNIFKKVKALIFHKIGYIVINGTDNIIISKYFGIVAVGLYSNYFLIINSVHTIFKETITSITASIGNMLITNEPEKSFNVFQKVRFFNFVISCFSASVLLLLIQPFITLWIGKEYLLSFSVVYIIILNFFQKIQRCCYNVFKDSAGIWEEDKYIPLLESILNIVFSIICLKLIGIAGVFVGTIISGLTLWCYSYPKFVYKKLFKRNYWDYFKETSAYIILFLIISTITLGISNLLIINNIFLKLIVNTILCFICIYSMITIIFKKNPNYIYFKNLVLSILNKYLRKLKLKKV